jgi:hypothetical protein
MLTCELVFSSSTGKGKGAKKKDPAKRHTLFKKRYT